MTFVKCCCLVHLLLSCQVVQTNHLGFASTAINLWEELPADKPPKPGDVLTAVVRGQGSTLPGQRRAGRAGLKLVHLLLFALWCFQAARLHTPTTYCTTAPSPARGQLLTSSGCHLTGSMASFHRRRRHWKFILTCSIMAALSAGTHCVLVPAGGALVRLCS